MTASVITREIAEAGVGVSRLMRYDPRWPDGFNPTTAGFLRSFLGPLLGLPFSLVVAAMITSLSETTGQGQVTLWAAGLSHLLNALAFPILIGALAKPLKIGEGYAGFIIIVNWASLFVNMGAAAASLLTLGGRNGYGLFGLVWMVLFAVSLFITWRASRETLSPEIPVALLMVVLTVGLGVLSDQAIGFALGADG